MHYKLSPDGMGGFFKYLGKAAAHSFNVGWGIAGTVSLLIPTILAALGAEKDGAQLPSWLDWVSKHQGTATLLSFGIAAFVYLLYAPYKFNKDQQSEHAKETAGLKRTLETLTARRLNVRCEDGGPSTTVSHDASIQVPLTIRMDGSVASYGREPISLFGCAISNIAVNTINNCRAAVVSIEKDGIALPFQKGWLAFEAPNQGADLETVNIQNGSEQKFCVCSITHRNEVRLGTYGLKYRAGPIHQLFQDSGDYVFWVELSGDDMATQRERFVLTWRGGREQCRFRHERIQAT